MPSNLNEHATSVILIFLKAPMIGHVKTRLARSIGSKSALDIYQKLVEQQLSKIPKGYRIEIHFTPRSAFEEIQNWLGNGYRFYPQCEGQLGIRLEHSVVDAFKRGAKQVICIGGDCPKLDQRYFEQTTAALQFDFDVVFGPSEDGGYYLIGLDAPHPELFRGIPWSTESTLDDSLKKATALKLKVLKLETLYDVDEITELNRAIDEGILEV